MARKRLLQPEVKIDTQFCLLRLFLTMFVLNRESEPNSWEDAITDELDRGQYPRMPWHDVHCALWGPPCRDVARHFVQRWNHAKVTLETFRSTIADEPLL